MADPTLFGGRTLQCFLRDYWQKRPLLVRGAMPVFSSPMTPEELLGLACEPEALARIIIEGEGSNPWEVRYGPFDQDDFADLPSSGWTVLVQEVDRYVDEVRELLVPFRFVPNWRLDDVQVSYAVARGNAGPHVDSYDVFLLQGMGRREWQIGGMAEPGDAPMQEHMDLALLKDFTVAARWVLEPGDLLYLPPRYAHLGIALEPCLTYSIGFRAPDKRTVVERFLEHVVAGMDPSVLLSDYGQDASHDPGLIREETLEQVLEILRNAVRDKAGIIEWFGRLVTEAERGPGPYRLETKLHPDDVRKALTGGGELLRHAVPHFAHAHRNDGAWLFACGDSYLLPAGLEYAGRLVSGPTRLNAETLGYRIGDDALLQLLTALVNNGALEISRTGPNAEADD